MTGSVGVTSILANPARRVPADWERATTQKRNTTAYTVRIVLMTFLTLLRSIRQMPGSGGRTLSRAHSGEIEFDHAHGCLGERPSGGLRWNLFFAWSEDVRLLLADSL